jgi:hypothetical protein
MTRKASIEQLGQPLQSIRPAGNSLMKTNPFSSLFLMDSGFRRNDGMIATSLRPFLVIPAKAGIQFFEPIGTRMTGLHHRHGILGKTGLISILSPTENPEGPRPCMPSFRCWNGRESFFYIAMELNRPDGNRIPI